MRYTLMTAIVATTLIAPIGSAGAQSAGLMAECNRAVGQMKFEGWPADRNREMMMSSCLHNGGAIPGTAQQEQPVSLPTRHPKRAH
jgi:hypothetical protein